MTTQPLIRDTLSVRENFEIEWRFLPSYSGEITERLFDTLREPPSILADYRVLLERLRNNPADVRNGNALIRFVLDHKKHRSNRVHVLCVLECSYLTPRKILIHVGPPKFVNAAERKLERTKG
jgi:hypothetical protein